MSMKMETKFHSCILYCWPGCGQQILIKQCILESHFHDVLQVQYKTAATLSIASKQRFGDYSVILFYQFLFIADLGYLSCQGLNIVM
jgi:hypothetical protein